MHVAVVRSARGGLEGEGQMHCNLVDVHADAQRDQFTRVGVHGGRSMSMCERAME